MTDSFQSTAFQPQANPVDTFVQPVSVQPKSGIESLAETLAVVNPNIQKFLGTKIDEAVEKEKQKGFKIAVDEVLAEIGAGDIPVLQVMNKIDCLASTQPHSDYTAVQGIASRVWLSAYSGDGVEGLMVAIAERLGGAFWQGTSR